MQIPITISVASEPEEIKERIVMKGFEQVVTIDDVDPKDWIKVIFIRQNGNNIKKVLTPSFESMLAD